MTPIYIDRKRPQKNLWLRKRQAAEWHKSRMVFGWTLGHKTTVYGGARRERIHADGKDARPVLNRGWLSVKGTRDGRREQGSLSTRVHRVCIRLTSAQRASGHCKIPSVNRLRTSPLPPAPPASHPASHAHTTQGHILICYWRLHL